MLLDTETASVPEIYSTMIRAITPRPIAWVSTISPAGVTNLAPFSFFSGVGSAPASLMFSVVNKKDGSQKDTMRNIEANKQFVVNVVPFGIAESMAITAGEFPYEESEFDAANLTTQPSLRVAPPRVAESPIHIECELYQVVNVGEGPSSANVVIGKILLFDIDDAVLDADSKIDPDKVDTIGRMGGRAYCRTGERFIINPTS